MKIGLFSDTHYCGLELLEQDRKPQRAYAAVKNAFDDFKSNGVEVAVCLGDLIHYNESVETSKEYLKKISSLIAQYGIKTYACMGNHDNEVLSAEDFGRLSGIETAPCVADYENVRLIFLDASYYPDGKPYERVYVDWTQSFVPESEIEWLKEMLDTSKRCIVFIHQNIDTNVEKHHIVSNADRINSVLAEHKNICHVYQGHYHYGAESTINDIPYTTLRAMCIGEEENYIIAEV